MKKTGCVLLCLAMIIIYFYNEKEYRVIPKPKDYRNRYQVTMQLYPDEHYYDASMMISVKNTSDDPWDELVFRDYPSQFREDNGTKISQISSLYNETTGTRLDYQRDEDPTIVRIKLNEPLEPNMTTTISFFYQAFVPNLDARYGYVEKTPGQLDYYLGNSLPILCVYENGKWVADSYFSAGECFYSDVADYQVSITAPLDYTIIATGQEKVTHLTSQTRTTIMKAEAVRDFCLILGNDYKCKSINKDGIRYSSYYHTDNVEAGTKALNDLVHTIEEYSSILGTYPYPTLSTVETYTEMQGMEYPQLVMISSEMTGVVSTLRHELAHQWFYGVIGNNSYQEAWLDESVATYLAEEVIEGHQSQLDKKYGDFETDGDYVFAMYFSGGSMYAKLANRFGGKRLNDLLYQYIQKYAYQNVKTEDLIKMIINDLGPESITILNEYFSKNTMDDIVLP